MVDKGCRVMLFDLFGRGYSDHPVGVPHDVRLFSSQILLAATSSPLAWTGGLSGRFALIGYSLGGGIAAAFTANFPNLVSSLILISPAGLIRPYHVGKVSRILYSEGVIPEPILDYLVRRRLKTPLFPTKQRHDGEKPAITAAVGAELPCVRSTGVVPLSRSHPDVAIEKAVRFQVDHHLGFIPAFVSSIRHGPISDQRKDWEQIGHRLTEQKTGHFEDGQDMQPGKVLIICGARDSIIRMNELQTDATAALEENLKFKSIDAGHDLPIVRSEDVVTEIAQFWGI